MINSLNSRHVADVLRQLHCEAEEADKAYMTSVMTQMDASGGTVQTEVAKWLEAERDDYQAVYREWPAPQG